MMTVVALTVAALAALLRSSTDAPRPALQAATPAQNAMELRAVERGATVFAANCVACRGTGGRGDGPAAAQLEPKPANLTSEMHRAHSDDDYVNWITHGVPGSAMPAFGDTLSDGQIRDVVAFIRSLQAQVAGEPEVDIPGPEECMVIPRSPESFRAEGTITPQPTEKDFSYRS
jgi:mono/diheme cytochrome c family protein